MVKKQWRVIARPLLETILNSHAQEYRVSQPLFFHGPRGTGKTTFIQQRVKNEWNKGPHVTGYVDFAESVKDHHPIHKSYPWASFSMCEPPILSDLISQLESCLEKMVEDGARLGKISSQQIYSTLHKWHGIDTALCRIAIQSSENNLRSSKKMVTDKVSTSKLWDRAFFAFSARVNAKEMDEILGQGVNGKIVPRGKEALLAMRLAKEVLTVQKSWRANAIKHLNETGGHSMTLARSATDWPCLLLELLSQAAEINYYQPKLVINNIDLLRNAILRDHSTVQGSLYHDCLIWRIIALGLREKCLPIILVTSDSYYSFQAFIDFGNPDIFISRETKGWTTEEAKLHMVSDYFSDSEWKVIAEVLGPTPRHLFELYALKQSNYYQKIMDDKGSTFEDIVDPYLAYLQITVVNPAMEKALEIVQKFAADARHGRIVKDKLRFGSPWRRPPSTDNPTLDKEWAKLQLLDFIACLISAGFGLNYLADVSFEIFDDPAANALVEVGLYYAQREPPILRPVSRGIMRCLVCSGADANEVTELDPIWMAPILSWAWLSPFAARTSASLVEECKYLSKIYYITAWSIHELFSIS